MSNVVIYARYSSAKQREESIEGQIRVCKEYAQNHDMTVIREYSDRAESGLSFETRESAMQMIKDSEKHNFTAVLVYKLDRFTRDNADFYKYQKLLQKNGVDIISATENFGEGAQGEFMLGITTAYNHYYSRELGEKSVRGMTENINHGHSNGSYRKFGYNIIDKDYVVNPEEAEIVREVFRKYANGETIKDIIDSLNARGIRTACNKPFSHDYISRMLKNIVYTGTLRWNDIEFPGGVLRRLFQTNYSKRFKSALILTRKQAQPQMQRNRMLW